MTDQEPPNTLPEVSTDLGDAQPIHPIIHENQPNTILIPSENETIKNDLKGIELTTGNTTDILAKAGDVRPGASLAEEQAAARAAIDALKRKRNP